MTVKEVNINSEVFYINIIIIIIAEVGGAFALIITLYCTRFYTTRFRTTSKAVDKSIVIYRHNYIFSGFNWYWPI
jgi:hypothetical protein